MTPAPVVQGHLSPIFRHFLLCLQSAAFAPLLVTFCAISARINSQAQRTAELMLVCNSALTRLLQEPGVSRSFLYLLFAQLIVLAETPVAVP